MEEKNLNSNKSISIIVPFYNSEKFLLTFLKSFKSLNKEDKDIELILVDNGSTDKSKDILNMFIKNNPKLNIKYFYYNEKADSYASRNFAVRQANNKVLAFTDSDCILEKDWLDNICVNVREGVVVAGNIEIQIVDRYNIWEIFDSIAHLNNEKMSKSKRVATANLAVLKDDFYKVGYFKEQFSGGDHEWSMRADKIGLNIKYIDNVKVLHPSRKSFSEILKKDKRVAYGEGVNYRLSRKSFIVLVLRYFVKIFKISTNIRYSKELKKRDINFKNILEFNRKFMKIRMCQFKSAIYGYKGVESRKLNIS